MKLADKMALWFLPFAMPGLVTFAAFNQQGPLGVVLGAVAGGWFVVNWIDAGHTAYVLRDELEMTEDRDW